MLHDDVKMPVVGVCRGHDIFTVVTYRSNLERRAKKIFGHLGKPLWHKG